mgnify:CR=1 FL=1
MSGELEIMQSSIDGVELVRLQGEITAANATLVTAGVADLLKQGKNKILLDLRTIAYISSVGIGALTRSQANVAADGGRLAVVHAPGMVDRLYGLFGHPDLRLLLANAVGWMLGGEELLRVKAPATVDIALQKQPGRIILHLINLTGKRPQSEVIPVHGIEVAVRAPARPKRVLLATTGKEIGFKYEGGFVHATIDRLDVYDLLVIE